MHLKSGMYYYVSNNPRKWTKLSSDLGKAKVLWAQIEATEAVSGEFVTALQEWYASKRFEALSEASKIAYNKVKKPLELFFSGSRFSDIEPSHIADWLDNYHSPVLANIGRAVVSNVFQVALRRGKAKRNPCKDMPGLRIGSRTRYMTDDEFRLIRDKANDVVKVCMDIAYLTGLRISDILALRIGDIQSDGLYVIQSKTGSKQKYELTPELMSALEQAKSLPRSVKNITTLLCNRKGNPYEYAIINRMFWKAKQAAEITDVRFHDIRAKAATDAKAQGLNYQALLGHASQAMSDRYIRRVEFVKANPLRKKL
jgi:integrase